MDFDYFKHFDKLKTGEYSIKCFHCKQQKEINNRDLCLTCNYDHSIKRKEIMKKIADYYFEQEKYSEKFLKQEREIANILLKDLDIKYYGKPLP